MTVLTLTGPNPGDEANASDISTPLSQITAWANGGIDDSNIASVSGSKIAAGTVAASQLADDAVTAAKVADASIVPASLIAGTGTAWDWQSWTPTFTNLSGGTLNYAKYVQVGKTVQFRLKYTLGGAGVSGRITFTTPVTMESLTVGEILQGLATFDDVSVPEKKIGVIEWASTTTARLSASTSDTVYTGVSTAGTSSTVPFTFASGDIIVVRGTIEAA